MIQRKQRVPMRDLSTMTAEDRETVEKNSMNGRIFNIFKVLAHHPKLVKRWTPFAGHILGKQTLPFRDRELLILRIGWLNQAEYEFAQHELIARKGGISDTDIVWLKDGPKAAGWSEKDSALLQVADDLFDNSVVSDETWATMSKNYSTEQLMDAVFTVGQYNLVSWALNSFGVPLDDSCPARRSSVHVFRTTSCPAAHHAHMNALDHERAGCARSCVREDALSAGWRATGGEWVTRRMTNPFRRGVLASLRPRGEAEGLWSDRRADVTEKATSGARHVVGDGMP